MRPTEESVARLRAKLRLDTPLIAVYDCEPGPEFEPIVAATGRDCCFLHYAEWLRGATVVLRRAEVDPEKGGGGCPYGLRAVGLAGDYPPFMASFLSDGTEAPTGLGLFASPALAREAFLDHVRPVRPAGDTVLLGPLRARLWDRVRSVTFLVDADRLSAVLALCRFWSPERDLVSIPFSAGCAFLWRVLGEEEGDRPIVGGTDLSMRKYLPPGILTVTVSPARFERILGVPEGAFLDRDHWTELMDRRTYAGEEGSER